MTRRKSKLIFTCALLSCLIGIFGCGKKAEENKNDEVKNTQPITPEETEAYMQKQSISCGENSICPSYIAKIVVSTGAGKFRFCTGFLTDDNTLATSTSCLPPLLRLNGADCSRDVFFFFPKAFSKGQRVGCKTVLQASDNYGNDPLLNREDVAFLKLDKPQPFKRTLRIIRDGLPSNKAVTVVAVEQLDEENGVVKELECPSVHNSYVHPLVTSEFSPGISLAGCAFGRGFTGAPVIDWKNNSRVRGMVTSPMDPETRRYLIEVSKLLTNGLKEFVLGTNFACAPTIYDTNVGEEKECGKELTEYQVEKLRSAMLATTPLFAEFRTRLENALETGNKFIRYALKLIPTPNPKDPTKPNYDIQSIEITPKCFKDLTSMINKNPQTIYDFRLPRRTFKKTMDDLGRVQGSEIDNGNLIFNINFNAKDVKRNRQSPIYFWDRMTGNTQETFLNVPVCE